MRTTSIGNQDQIESFVTSSFKHAFARVSYSTGVWQWWKLRTSIIEIGDNSWWLAWIAFFWG